MRRRFLSLFALLLIAIGCSGGGGGSTPRTAAEIFVDNLNYEDLVTSYWLAKDPTNFQGYIVVELDDGSFRTIDIEDGVRWAYLTDWDYFWDNSEEVWWVGNGYYEDIWGNLYEKTNESSKDLMKVSAKIEQAAVKKIGEQLAANYGLSEKRGIQAAKLVAEYKALGKQRSLTDADANAFSKELLGFSITDAMKAYKKYEEGDKKSLDDLIDEAADTLETTPENVNDIMKNFLK